MSLVLDMAKGFAFTVCGRFGEPLQFTDEKTGETQRMIRIEGFGKTYNFRVESDEELDRCPPLNTEVRASGVLRRKGGATHLTTQVMALVTPGQTGWKPYTDDDYVAGCNFGGWGLIVDKRLSEFRGQTYRSLQVGTVGDTLVFRDFSSHEFFVSLPEKGPVFLSGHLEPKVGTDDRRNNVHLIPVLENFRLRENKEQKPVEAPKAA